MAFELPKAAPLPTQRPADGIPPLPPGFQLDAPMAAAPKLPPLPEGFTLDSEPAPAADSGSFVKEVGKGVAAGATNVVGSMLKGLSAEQARSPEEEATANQLAADFPRIPQMSDAEYNQFRIKAGKGIRGLKEMDMLALAASVRAGQMPVDEAAKRLNLPAILPTLSVKETPLYKAGQKVHDFASDKFKSTKDYEDSWTRSISEGLGSTVPFLATAPLGGAGMVVGAVGGSAASSGEAIDRAVQAGASQQQIIDAVRLGRFPGLTDQVPIEILFERVPLPLAGKLAGVVGKVLAQAAAEGGQEALQQAAQNMISRYVYNPDQDLTEGVLESAALGAIVGGGMKVGEQSASKVFGGGTKSAAQGVPSLPDGFVLDQPTENADARAPVAAAAGPELGEAVLPQADEPAPATTLQPSATPEDRALLRASGLVDDDIDQMSPDEVAAEVERARQANVQQPLAAPPEPVPVEPTELSSVAPEAVPAPAMVERRGPSLAVDADPAEAMSVAPEAFGTRSRPAKVETADDVARAGERVEPEPSDAQKEAGNYTKGHIKIAGHDVTIENPKGSVRRGVSPTGTPWETTMPGHYGYIKRTQGADGDHVDVYIGDNPKSKRIYIVDQKAPSANGRFDEHKVVMGADSMEQARELYARGFSDGTGNARIGAISALTPKAFREWLASGETTKPYRMGRVRLTETGHPADAKGRVKRPPTLTEFLAGNGGLKDERGELRAMDAHKVLVPGSGRLVRTNGLPLDKARALAVENGYLSDAEADQLATSTVDDLLMALRDDMAGQHRFSSTDQEWSSAWSSHQASETDARRAEGARAQLQELAGLKEGDPFLDRAVSVMVDEGLDAADALERAALQLEAEDGISAAAADDLPFFEERPDEAQRRGAPESRSDVRAEGESRDGPDEEVGAEGSRPPTQGRGEGGKDRVSPEVDGRSAAESTAERQPEEVGADGKPQLVLPGAERISQKEEAERKAAKPLRSKAPQKDPGGLFSDDSKQSDLVDMARKPSGGETASSKADDSRPPMPSEKAAPTPSAKIEDFGEKIHGARKDMVSLLSDELQDQAANVAVDPLSKTFPLPNYAKLAEEGVDRATLALVAVFRDQIPPKPKKSWKLDRWVFIAQSMRDFAGKVLSGKVSAEKMLQQLEAHGWSDFQALGYTARALVDVEPSKLAEAAKWRIMSGNYSMFGGQRYNPPKKMFYIVDTKGRMLSGLDRSIGHAETADDAITNLKTLLARVLADAKPAERSNYTPVGLYRDRAGNSIFIGFKVRSTVIRLKGGFATSKEARAYVEESRDELQAKIDEMRAGPAERRATNDPRKGRDWREGDIAPETFSEAFGFRSVQFGNYVEGARRQADLNRAYDALMDLADAVTLPPKALSLNGKLGLAFGARGHGGKNAAAAHYEPGQVVINLTKNAGPGSLAHEWLHALDNYFAKEDQAGGFMSDRRRVAGPVRQEVYDAWKAVEKSITRGSFAARSADLDGARSKPYFSTTIEKAARSFERYIVDRLAERGFSNDYLANINLDGGAYPTSEEMDSGIRAAYDQLFSAIEAKEEGGSVRLYSTAEPVVRLTGLEVMDFKGGADMPALRAAARKWYDEHLRGTTATMRDGSVVSFNQRGRNKSVSGGKGDMLLRSIPAIRDIIENGHVVLVEPGDRDFVRERIVISAPVEFAGKVQQLAVTVHRTADGTLHYDLHFDRDAGGPGIGARLADGEFSIDSSESTASSTDVAADDINLMVWPEVRNAPAGWDVAGEMDAPQPMPTEVQADIRQIVEQVAGLGNVSFWPHISLPDGAQGWGTTGRSSAGGFYEPTRDIVVIALDSGNRRTAYHEAFHRLQHFFLTEAERRVLAGETERLRQIVATNEFRRAGIAGMAQHELEAEAFAIWSDQMDRNNADGIRLHIGLRRAWERIRQTLRRVRNALRGRGYQTSEDVFARARSGETARRGRIARKPLHRRSYQAAYHGSPHQFENFSTEHIGSGEGNQAFGWGLYFAGRKEVAEYYRNALARPADGEIERAKQALRDTGINPEEDYGYNDERDYLTLAASLVKGFKPKLKDGRLFEVDIPDDSELLNWDAPLRDQPDPVLIKVDRFIRDLVNLHMHYGGISEDVALDMVMGFSGADLYEETVSLLNGPEETSKAFLRAGLPGHRYLDGMSRDEGEGTYNYVIYDDSRIKVERFYSLAERVPASVPAKDVPGALVGQRLDRALRRGVAAMKGLSSRDRGIRNDGETASDYLHRKWVDYLHPLRMMQERSGHKLTELNDAYLNARLAEDAALAQIQTMHDVYVTPMVDALVAANASIEDLHRYLYALHAEERNRVVGKRNPPDSELFKAVTDHDAIGASGMSTNEARRIITGYRKDPQRFRGLNEAAGHVRQMLDNEMRNQRRAGLISDETYRLLSEQWQHYVPLKGNEGQDEEGFWKPGKSGFDVRGDEFKAALGRYSEADNIVAHAIVQSESSILRQKKNDVGKAMLRFINEFDPKGEQIAQVFWGGEGDFDIVKAPAVYKRVIDASGKVTKQRVPNPFSNRDDVLAAKVGGKTYWIRFKDPKIGRALRKLGTAEIGSLTKIVRPLTVWQSIVNTRANPAFTPINVIRDVQAGAVHLLDEGFSVVQVAGVVRDIPKAWGAIWRQQRQTAGSSEWDRFAKEYFDAGGKISFHNYATLEESLKRLEKQVSRSVDGENHFVAAIKAVFRFIGDLNDAGENGIRLAAYVAARKAQGRTAKQAAYMARDLTVDFKKHGEKGPEMSAWFVFFNAALQGNYNIAKRMVQSKAVRAAVASFIFGGMMQHLWNSMMSGEDDDGESYYRKMLVNEPWKLERQFVFFIPGTERYVAFPMPYGYNAFHHLGTQGAALMTGDKAPVIAILDAVRVAFDAFNPIGSGSIANMVSPTIVDPAVDILANENFAGAPIYPEENPFDRSPDPQSSKAFAATHPAFIWIAKMFNRASGGNEIEPGAVDIHPDTLEHLWGYFVGGLGRFVTQAEQSAEGAVRGELEPKKVPWVRNFYGAIDEDSQRTEYFRKREAVFAVEGYMKAYQEKGDEAALREFMGRHRVELEALGAFKAAEKARRAINKQRRRGDPDKAQLEELKKRELEAMRGARTAYVEAAARK